MRRPDREIAAGTRSCKSCEWFSVGFAQSCATLSVCDRYMEAFWFLFLCFHCLIVFKLVVCCSSMFDFYCEIVFRSLSNAKCFYLSNLG